MITFFKYDFHKKLKLYIMSFRIFLQLRCFTTRKNNVFNVHITRYMKLFTTYFSRTKNIKKVYYCVTTCKKYWFIFRKKLFRFISFFFRCARHNDKFVTRLSFVIHIVWFTKLDNNNIAFIFFSNLSSYIKKDSSRKI